MATKSPHQLVDEFKKSGEFDRLRRELLGQFQRGDGLPSFTSRYEDIARKRLASDQKLQYMPQDRVHRELMQEIDRYPIVERAVAEVRMLSDPAFAAGIRQSVQRFLREDSGGDSNAHTSTLTDNTAAPDSNPSSESHQPLNTEDAQLGVIHSSQAPADTQQVDISHDSSLQPVNSDDTKTSGPHPSCTPPASPKSISSQIDESRENVSLHRSELQDVPESSISAPSIPQITTNSVTDIPKIEMHPVES